MTDDLVRRLRDAANGYSTGVTPAQAADRIEELERHVELRDWFLVENDLWEKFVRDADGRTK